MARGVWAKGLPAVALALALMGGGAKAQQSDAWHICKAFAGVAKQVMASRQDDIAREDIDRIFTSGDAGLMKDLSKWMIDEAYGLDIADDPAAADRMIRAFEMRAQVECMSRMVDAALSPDGALGKMCKDWIPAADQLFFQRQAGIPRAVADHAVAQSRHVPSKLFSMWLVDEAYKIEITQDVDKRVRLSAEFRQKVLDQCYQHDWL